MSEQIRVSMAALLRVGSRYYGRLVLVNTGKRIFGPFGGAVMHDRDFETALSDMGWQAEDFMRTELRGVLPADRLQEFRAWFDTGEDRESGAQCLRRELAEESVEAGLDRVAEMLDGVGFVHKLTVTEPLNDHGGGRRGIRTFELFDLDKEPQSRALCDELERLAGHPETPQVIAATRFQIRAGRAGSASIGGHARYVAMP